MHSRSGTAHPKLVSKIRQVAITDLNGEIVSLPFGKRPRSGPKVRPLLLEFDEGGGEEPLGSSGIACTKAAFELALADERAQLIRYALAQPRKCLSQDVVADGRLPKLCANRAHPANPLIQKELLFGQ